MIDLAKRKRRYRRRRRTYRRRKRKPKFPIVSGLTLAGTFFTPPVPGWQTPFDAIKAGDMAEVFRGLLAGWTGINYQETGMANPFEVINPLNFGRAPYLKMMFWSVLSETLMNKFVPSVSRKIGNLPFIGKYITL